MSSMLSRYYRSLSRSANTIMANEHYPATTLSFWIRKSDALGSVNEEFKANIVRHSY